MKEPSGSEKRRRHLSFATPLAQLHHFDRKFRLGADIDAVLETCVAEQKDLATATAIVFTCLNRHLQPTLAFLRSFNEDLEMTTYTYGCLRELLEQTVPDLFEIGEPTVRRTPAVTWFAMPLDMSGETVGILGIAFPHGTPLEPKDLLFDLLDTVAEELDSYFFSIQENRRKHRFILDIQHALSCSVPSVAVHKAAALLLRGIPCQELLIIHREEDRTPPDDVRYTLYREGQRLFESDTTPHPGISRIIRESPKNAFDAVPDLLAPLFPGNRFEAFKMPGTSGEEPLGVVIATPSEGATLSIASRDRLQLFAEALRQRLADFNHDLHRLRRNFAPEIAAKLLDSRDYRNRFLVPRTAEIGRMAIEMRIESAEPSMVGLLHEWLCSAAERLFKNGAALEPSPAGSLIALFGPPFFEWSRTQLLEQMLSTASALNAAWQDISGKAEFSGLQTAGLAPRTAMTLETAHIAYIGPYNDIHAFPCGHDVIRVLLSGIAAGETVCSCFMHDEVKHSMRGRQMTAGPIYIDDNISGTKIKSYRLKE
ncbi:MAG TPA: hypothetical protein PKM25_06945 [Candidatus Ozemobacteraceae bacterium]|nr:hypothetical protein [Candidatus Ozemobacteraceae bacterium]